MKRKREAEELSRRAKQGAPIGPSGQGGPSASTGHGSSSGVSDLDIMGFQETQLLSESVSILMSTAYLAFYFVFWLVLFVKTGYVAALAGEAPVHRD